MTDSEMSLIATEGSLFITLDGGGVTIQSNSGIVASGGQEITLESEKKIGIEAQETIFLQCGDSSMILDGMTDLKGSEVLLDGLIKMPVTVEDLEPVPEAPFVSEVQVEEEPEEEKKGFWGKVLDVTQTVLDVVGMIPVVGEVADLANAAIYAARGDYTNAALSAAAAIPFVGWAATGAKFAIKGAKLVKKAGKVVDSVVGAATKIADKAGQVAKAIGDLANKAGDAISGALGKVMTKAKGLASNFSPADLANKLKGKLDALMMKSPKLGNALTKATDFTRGLMADLMSDAMFSAAIDMLSNYADSNILLSAMMIVGSTGGGGKKGTTNPEKKKKAKKKKKLREQYLGRTPGKKSRTGREVIERMKNEKPPKIRKTRSGKIQYKASDDAWYDLSTADMAHRNDPPHTDAVTWWNNVGRYHGAKSKEVRDWMLDSNNYVLDHYSLNRSDGAKLNQKYLPPKK
ncbi:GH-E family nuclease [Paenibacillus sp. DCT19]|uniref:GH-E family nuclease n=1 Tax=Paenibacillus sp. DCT19 TaxID=2211212 RepID=UPI0020C44920|nr:GH-E family nuclease [Paenibacillus sp. DCT19]